MFNQSKSMILKGPRVTLRPIKLSDAPSFVKWFKDKEVVRYMGHNLYGISLAGEKGYLKNIQRAKDELPLAIMAEDGRHIGSVTLHLSPDNKRAVLGILIGDRQYWGRGYAGECIKLLGDYLFKRMKYNRLTLTVFVENKRAQRVYAKVGFKLEGTLRRHIWSDIDNKFHDEYTMSILRCEWPVSAKATPGKLKKH